MINIYTLFEKLNNKGLVNWVPDELFLKCMFRAKMDRKLNLSAPNTYNEKLQWLKLYDRNPRYCVLVDKYEVKKFVKTVIGEEHIIKTLGIWNSFDEIDFEKLPNSFVLKCTHDSGGLIICKEKSKLNVYEARKKINRSMRVNYYYHNREWPYKDVKPRIIAEEYMEDESGYELKDYKWFCFNGVPKLMFIASDRGDPATDTKFDFFDMEFNHMPFTNGHPNSEKTFVKPKGFETMKEMAINLSTGIPHARIDFYDINGKVYFGEITLFHWSGMKPFEPESWDYTLGEWINLPVKK